MDRSVLVLVFTVPILYLPNGCQPVSPTQNPENSTPSPSVTPTETPRPTAERQLVYVPHGEPQAIDGSLSPGEWDEAGVEKFSDGSQILLMSTDGYLYLGIRANTTGMIVGNVFIDEGQHVEILHASAALGAATYQKEGNVWKQVQGFDWCCRATQGGESAQAEREAHFQKEQWTATNSRIGTPNELEYQIQMPDGSLRIAVNYIQASDPNRKIPWPSDLDDDCVKPTPGGLPELLYFSPEKWALVAVLSPGKQ